MPTSFHRIGLVITHEKPEILQALQDLVQFLQNEKLEPIIETATAQSLPNNHLATMNLDEAEKECDLLLVIGGDGSLLRVARKIVHQNIPLLGINRGSLGFLTDICPDEIHSRLKSILKGKYHKESRFLLEACIDDKECLGLNEIVLSSKSMAKMITFDVYVNEKFMCRHRADGMIVSTPTGSTAYSLSAGGPILHPGLDAIMLLPMFPHTLTSRPIIIDGNAKISVHIAEHNEITPYISGDSDTCLSIPPGKTVQIQKMKEHITLIHPTDYDYFETLRSKLHWG